MKTVEYNISRFEIVKKYYFLLIEIINLLFMIRNIVCKNASPL